MRECKIVSRKFELENSHTLEVAKANGGYRTLSKMAEYTPVEMIEIIQESNLRGKGGGGAPAGDKWGLMPQNSDKPSFLAVNCDESEPGTFKDREIISKDPHLLIEGILLTCYAIKAKHAYIYIRGEYYQYQQILFSLFFYSPCPLNGFIILSLSSIICPSCISSLYSVKQLFSKAEAIIRLSQKDNLYFCLISLDSL